MKGTKRVIKEREKILKEVDLGYHGEYFNSGVKMQCKRISYCSCDCDLCVIGGVLG